MSDYTPADAVGSVLLWVASTSIACAVAAIITTAWFALTGDLGRPISELTPLGLSVLVTYACATAFMPLFFAVIWSGKD